MEEERIIYIRSELLLIIERVPFIRGILYDHFSFDAENINNKEQRRFEDLKLYINKIEKNAKLARAELDEQFGI